MTTVNYVGHAPQPEILGPSSSPCFCDSCGREEAEYSVCIFPPSRCDSEETIGMDLCETCLAYERKYASLSEDEAERFADERGERLKRIWSQELWDDA